MRLSTTLAMGALALVSPLHVVTGHPVTAPSSPTIPTGNLREAVSPDQSPKRSGGHTPSAPQDREVARWWSRPSYPPVEAVHTITAVYWYEGLVEFEDGSRWMATLDSSQTPRSLTYGERVTFRQNRSWFAQTPFELVLLRTGEVLPISPYQGPVLSSPYLRALAALDAGAGVLEASDGTLWELDRWHRSYSRVTTWAFQDVLMVGHHHDGWTTSQYPVLLYNCGADCWIPARRVR